MEGILKGLIRFWKADINRLKNMIYKSLQSVDRVQNDVINRPINSEIKKHTIEDLKRIYKTLHQGQRILAKGKAYDTERRKETPTSSHHLRGTPNPQSITHNLPS